jgi:signal transduction histidine kinase
LRIKLSSLERSGRRSSRSDPYTLAVVLPILAEILTTHFTRLHALPYGLHFTAMVVVATLGGLSPALLCIVCSVLSQAIFPSYPGVVWPLTTISVLRPSALVVSAVIISLLTRNRRRASEALEAALAALQEQSAALIESQQASKCASWTYGRNDRTRWFPGGYEVFGIPFAELERLPSPISLILPEDQPAVREAVGRMLASGGTLRVEYRTLWPNGELHWSEARGNPVPGNPNLWRGVTFDTTERKLAETALIQNEKLAAMGRLASTVAHEINNPLEAVTNLLYLARRTKSIDPEIEEHLAMAEKELARLGNITRLTLGFVRTSPILTDVNMVQVLDDVLSIFHHRLEMKNIRIERSGEEAVYILIAVHELRQIVINLISNAVDALSRPDARICVSIQQVNGIATLTISDNGSGIAEPNLGRVFDAFFTTKAEVGTGIGLWVSRELVEKNGGTISVQSGKLPGGFSTSFRLEFPVYAAASSSVFAAAGARAEENLSSRA